MSADLPADLVARARDWVADDPDPATRAELDALIDAATSGEAEAVAELADRFAADLSFGTAGLRGAMAAGANRMNLAVVIRAASAIGSWVGAEGGVDAARRGVAIGFDARANSAAFAEATAEVLAARGVRALVLPEALPTPLLAFAVRHLGAAAGIMVTASHNPRGDNGYKVYDGSGRQIVAPTDGAIAAAMAAVGRVCEVPRTGPDDPDLVRVGPELVDAYVEAAAAVAGAAGDRRVRIAYTAMHGVGAATFRRVLAAAGFPPPVEVAAQVAPDPAFPTVAFPNPEESGALDLGLATAAGAGADVLLAHDPDADRLGAAVPDPVLGPPDDPAGWRVLSGDEIGWILADHLLATGSIPTDGVLATTIVSSTMLARLAEAAGRPHAETLTGFKWIARAPKPGQVFGFGYEEALGFCVGSVVADKDGITAAVVLAEAVATQARAGRTVLDVLDDLECRHGVHRTAQHVTRLPGLGARARLAAVMSGLRAAPPASLAGREVQRLEDLRDGDPVRGFVPADVVLLHLDGARVVVRPSGTEPKLKCYVEVVEPVADGDLAAARARAGAAVAELVDAVAELVAP